MRPIILALFLASASAPVGFIAPAAAQTPRVDARAEVAAALFAASATQAAELRNMDARLRLAHTEIERLQAGGQSARAQLIAAQEAYVADLAERDRAYAQEIGVFRGAVENIASTPEGAALLAQRRPGNLAEVRRLLRQLADRQAAAIQTRANVEIAVSRRSIAAIALDDLGKGEATTDEVIVLYQEVTRLDPTVHADWYLLAFMYWTAGRLDAAAAAADRSLALAHSDEQLGLSYEIKTNIAILHGDFQRAATFAERSLAARSRLARSNDPASLHAAAMSEVLVGDALVWGSQPASAEPHFARGLATARALLAREPDSGTYERTIYIALERLGQARYAQGNFVGARAAYVEMFVTAQGLQDANPTLTVFERDVAGATLHVADMDVLLGHNASALKGYQSTLEVFRQLQAADPSSFVANFDVASVQYRLAGVLLAQGDLLTARTLYETTMHFAESVITADPTHVRARVGLVLCLIGLADVALLSNDVPLARTILSQASNQLTTLNGVIGASSLVARSTWMIQVRLANIPEAGVSWHALERDYETIQSAAGILTAGDLLFIERARTGQAAER